MIVKNITSQQVYLSFIPITIGPGEEVTIPDYFASHPSFVALVGSTLQIVSIDSTIQAVVDLMEQAKSIAMELVLMPKSQCRMKLDNIMNINPFFHFFVKGSMDKIRNKMRTQGMNMILQEGQ